MDAFKHLQAISLQKTILFPEGELLSNVLKIIESECKGINITEAEKVIYSLLLVNEGKLSFQCSICLAKLLLKLYQKENDFKLWNAINFTIENISQSTIVFTGFLCKYLGKSNKSQLPRFVEFLLKNGSCYDLESIYALNCCFKLSGNSLTEFVNGTFNFTKNIIIKNKQIVVLNALKLLKYLVFNGLMKSESEIDSLLKLMKICLEQYRMDQFIIRGIAEFIAWCCFEPIMNQEKYKKVNNNEWELKINKKLIDFSVSFKIMLSFPTITSEIFKMFLNILEVETITENHEALLKFVQENIPNDLNLLIPFLPSDFKFIYFKKILKEQRSAKLLSTLTCICPNDIYIKESSKIALELYCSKLKIDKDEANLFFGNFAKNYPFLIEPYLKEYFSKLSNPEIKEIEVIGYTNAICSILKNLNDKESYLNSQKKHFIKLIVEYLKDEQSQKCVSIFKILKESTKYFASLSIVSKTIEMLILKKSQNFKLLKSVFSFRSKFNKKNQALEILKLLLNNKSFTFSMSLLQDISKTIPKLKSNDDTAYKSCILILDKVLSLNPSQTLIKSFNKNTIPVSSDILEIQNPFTKSDQFLDTIIRKFPLLVASCKKEEQNNLIEKVLNPKLINSVSLLLLASMCESHYTRTKMPNNLHIYLLKLLPRNKSLYQIISECIVLFGKKNKKILSLLFNYIEQNQTTYGCILLSSIASHITLPNDLFIRAMKFLQGQINNKTTEIISFHALSILFDKHPMYLSSYENNKIVYESLLHKIHQKISFHPMTLFILGDYFQKLIELFSGDLIEPNSNISNMIKNIIYSIKLIPTDFSKQTYFKICRTIYAFANSFVPYAKIQFPKSKGTNPIFQLYASQALTDLLKFKSINIDSLAIIKSLLILLQRTNDSRAFNLLISFGSIMKENELSFWVSTIKNIVLLSSLFDSQNLTVEPIDTVKKACIDISEFVVDLVSKSKLLNTEYLDDIIASLCRAIETGNNLLQKSAFPVLEKVIHLFSCFTSEDGENILDLYDSQFVSAVKVGFQLDLNISGGFLSSYLIFNADNMGKNLENYTPILIVYLSSLKKCIQRTKEFYLLASHICRIGQKHSQIHSLILPFLNTLTNIFAEIVFEAISLWKYKNDWKKISLFREKASEFYGDLLPSFVWLQSITNNIIIPNDILISFFLLEINYNKEKWMVSAAFEGLSYSICICGSSISSEVLELVVRTSLSFSEIDESEILNQSAILVQSEPCWDSLRKSILSIVLTSKNYSFSPKLFAQIIYSDIRKIISPYSLSIAYFLIEKFRKNEISLKSIKALLILLLNHSPNIIESLCNYIMDQNDISTELKQSILKICLPKLNINDNIQNVQKYLLLTFKKGGMDFIAETLISNPNLGIYLFIKGGAKMAFILSSKDDDNLRAYMWFLQLGLLTLEQHNHENDNKFALFMFAYCLKSLDKLKTHFKDQRMTIYHFIRIIKDSIRILGDSFEKVYEQMDKSIKRKYLSLISEFLNEEEQKEKIQKLIEISENEKKSTSEWQDLDLTDSF